MQLFFNILRVWNLILLFGVCRIRSAVPFRVKSTRLFQSSVPEIQTISSPQDSKDSVLAVLNRLHRSRNTTGVIHTFLSALKEKQLDSYEKERLSYNIGIQALLKGNRNDLVWDLLASIKSTGVKLSPDTIHILISDAFFRGNVRLADSIFEQNFGVAGTQQLHTAPVCRSFNIMIEGHRSRGDIQRAKDYFNLMKSFSIVPDLYSYSSIVRMAESGAAITGIVNSAAKNLKVSPPLVRCAIESLGKLGCPSDAVSTALAHLTGNNSVFQSPRSGDTLITALLTEPDRIMALPLANGQLQQVRADAVAFALSGLVRGVPVWVPLERVPVEGVWGVQDIDPTFTVKMGSKGMCLLFSHMYLLSDTNGRGFDAELQNMRNQLWMQVKVGLMKSAASGARGLSPLPPAGSESEEPLVLNGRLAYAVLRCFSMDVAIAKEVWRRDLLPLAMCAEKVQPGALQEISEKALEGLMYSCGLCCRPDTGLEIARSVRKRNWTRAQMEILSRKFFEGKRASKVLSGGQMFNNILNRGLEKSLMSELGAFDPAEIAKLESKLKYKTIRFRFGDHR